MATTTPPPGPITAENLGLLFRRLADQSEALLRQEVDLAKLEIRETVIEAGRAAAGVALAGALAAAAGLALVAAVILLLGPVIGSYWGSALIVAAVLLVAAGVLGKRGADRLRNTSFAATARALKMDARWAADEVREFREEVL